MAKGTVVALTPVRFGKAKKGEVQTFNVGDSLTGLSEEQVDAMVEGGSALAVEGGASRISAKTDDPTVKRDTLMLAAGKYDGAQPAAVTAGIEIVTVVENTPTGSSTRTTIKGEGAEEGGVQPSGAAATGGATTTARAGGGGR